MSTNKTLKISPEYLAETMAAFSDLLVECSSSFPPEELAKQWSEAQKLAAALESAIETLGSDNAPLQDLLAIALLAIYSVEDADEARAMLKNGVN